jgi:nicotinate-nucleotide pyrophosphorylase (carboxylating)
MNYFKGKKRPLLEISGGINLKNIDKFRNLKADWISLGSLTHSATGLDFSLEIENRIL